MFYISDHFKLSVLATPFSLYSAFSSFDQFKIVSLSRDSCSFYDDIIGNLFMSIPSPSFSYGWFVIFSVIISAIMWSMFHQGMSLLKELEKHHLKEKHQQMLLEEEIKHLHLLDDEYQKLYRWNHDTSNHLLALSLLIEQKKYDQALSYIHTLNTSREETKL